MDSGGWPGRALLSTENGSNDDRPMIKELVSDFRIATCPLSKAREDIETYSSNKVIGTYDMYYGSYMVRSDANTAMLKVTDEMTYNGESYTILMSDIDHKKQYSSGNVRWWATAHETGENDRFVHVYNTNTFKARWQTYDQPRGDLYRNFLRQDGSVFVISDLGYDDERVNEVPFTSKTSGSFANEKTFLPAD